MMLFRAPALSSAFGIFLFDLLGPSVMAAQADSVRVVFEDGGVVDVSGWSFRYGYKYSPCGGDTSLYDRAYEMKGDLLLELDRTTTTKRGVTVSEATRRRIAGSELVTIAWEWTPRPAKGHIPDVKAVVLTLASDEVLRLTRVTPSLDLVAREHLCHPRDAEVALVGKARIDGKLGDFRAELESPAPDSEPANTVVRMEFAKPVR